MYIFSVVIMYISLTRNDKRSVVLPADERNPLHHSGAFDLFSLKPFPHFYSGLRFLLDKQLKFNFVLRMQVTNP